MPFDYEAMERLRAHHVIAKAQRDGDNIVQALSNHGVSRSILETLEFDTTAPAKRGKRNKEEAFHNWATKNAGKDVTVEDLEAGLQISKPTAYKIIRDNPGFFVKARRGAYTVHDVISEREQAKQLTVK